LTVRQRAKRPRPERPADSLSKDRVVATALSIIDRAGMEAFSMRALAQALGVYPTAVYWYVANRNALLAEVVAHALRDVEPPEDAVDWTAWLKELFRRYRQAVRRHPNLAALMGAQMVSNAGVNPALVENILTVLASAGFKEERLVQAFNSVIATMTGFVTIEFATAPAEDGDRWAAELKQAIHAVDTREHPVLARNLPRLANRAFILRWQNGTEVPLDDSFETYIDVAVKGLAQQLSDRKRRRVS
jgi:TetR/AcrR family tetracycline transcriptional repressor